MGLLEYCAGAPVVAMLGMCKNAGKTTALNRLIREAAEAGETLGLTSIGRDGESLDLVTGTAKPPIYLYEGSLAATVEGLLPFCDVSREILDTTDIYTSMGRVTVFRARSDGFVQLAGPSMVEQLGPLRRRLGEFGAERVLIDGALSRRSPAAGAADGACILSTGASLDRDIDAVVAETAYVSRLLLLPERPAPGAALDRFTLFAGDRTAGAADMEGLLTLFKNTKGERTALFSGALSEAQGKALLRAPVKKEGLTLLLGDGSRCLLRRETWEALERQGARLAVLGGSRLAAVTVNPVSAGGWRFDREELLEKTRAAVEVPVVDVENME